MEWEKYISSEPTYIVVFSMLHLSPKTLWTLWKLSYCGFFCNSGLCLNLIVISIQSPEGPTEIIRILYGRTFDLNCYYIALNILQRNTSCLRVAGFLMRVHLLAHTHTLNSCYISHTLRVIVNGFICRYFPSFYIPSFRIESSCSVNFKSPTALLLRSGIRLKVPRHPIIERRGKRK